MNISTSPELRFVFRTVAEVGSYLPPQQRDVELRELFPIIGGAVEAQHLIRTVFEVQA